MTMSAPAPTIKPDPVPPSLPLHEAREPRCAQCGEPLPRDRYAASTTTRPVRCPDCDVEGLPHTD